MFPLSTVLFPHARLPLHVFEPRYRALTQDCLASDSSFGVVLIERGSEVGGGDQRMDVGTRATIIESVEFPDGRWLLLVQGEERFRVADWLGEDPYPAATVEDWPPRREAVDPGLLRRVTGIVRQARGLLSESGDAPAMAVEAEFDEDPDIASWQLCAEAPLNMIDAHRLLSARGTVERLELLRQVMEEMVLDLHRMLGSGS